jgi:tRNA(Glu) U13 pseudouridine synthase TruD
VLTRELEALADDRIGDADLERHRALGEGTRRVLRVVMEEFSTERSDDCITVRMTLPRGAYATTALGLAAELVQPKRDDGGERSNEPEGKDTEEV